MQNVVQRMSWLTSVNFFVIVVLTTILSFNFLDIFIFEASRSMHGVFFSFFKNIIDPLSDLLDPLNIIILCLTIILANLNIDSLLKNKTKLNLLEKKTGFNFKKIKATFSYSTLICKHIVFSLILAGVVCNILKYIIGVSRPKYFFLEGFERIDFFNLNHKMNSLPSGHTQAAFTIAILLIIYLNRYTISILIVASLMGISRIFMSMHFPSDIIFGAYVGSIFPILLFKLYFKKRLEKFSKDNLMKFSEFVKLMYWRIFI